MDEMSSSLFDPFSMLRQGPKQGSFWLLRFEGSQDLAHGDCRVVHSILIVSMHAIQGHNISSILHVIDSHFFPFDFRWNE